MLVKQPRTVRRHSTENTIKCPGLQYIRVDDSSFHDQGSICLKRLLIYCSMSVHYKFVKCSSSQSLLENLFEIESNNVLLAVRLRICIGTGAVSINCNVCSQIGCFAVWSFHKI